MSGLVQLLTAEQVAEALGVSPDWVYRAAREGQLPAVRLGRRVRFRPAAVELAVDGMESGGELLLARGERRQSATGS